MGLALTCAALLAGASFVVPASAQLLISPLQVTMEGRTRSEDIVLVNTTQKSNTYRLEWEQVEQNPETGRYMDSDMNSGKLFLQNFAVFTPRQITLAPGETQNIRIAVRRPADLADGEYKSHLKFKIITSVAPKDNRVLKKGESSFGAQVNTSFTIPVVYRSGEYDCAIELGEPSFGTSEGNGNLFVELPVSRSGIHGVIGQIDIYYTPQGGEERILGQLGNANIFPEINDRTFKIPTQDKSVGPGSLRIVFQKAEGKDKSTHKAMAEKSYPVGG